MEEWLGALDVYEDIVAKGWATSAHLIRLGHCYMNCRQRQNSRDAWLRAWEADPNSMEAVDLLDRFFPGWEKRASRDLDTQVPLPMPPPPPPPTATRGSGGLIVETTNFAPPPPKPVVSPPPTSARPAPRPPVGPGGTVGGPAAGPMGGYAGAPMSGQGHSAPAPASDAALVGGSRELKVNWSFIMADAAEEAARSKKHK